jgi:hypothetical protein
MASQPPESGEPLPPRAEQAKPEPQHETESQKLLRETEEAAPAVAPAKPPWWKFWARR